jgi:hypothetical protein
VDGKNEDSKSPSGKTATDRLAELEAEVMGAQTGLAVAKEPDNVFATHGTTKKLALFWGVLIASVILSKLPGADIFFTPLNQFATMVHEMGHAIICLFTGGHVSGMTIVADGQGHGGLTFSQGGIPFLHIQAGYLGTAVFGCLLLYLSQFHKLSKAILVAIGSLMAMASIYFILPTLLSPAFLQGLFSLIWAVAMASATIFAGVKLKDANANLVLIFLAIYTAMDSLRSISVVLSASLFGSTVWSDATVMEHNFILPAIFWSFLWATLSVVMLATTVWFTYGFGTIKGKKSKEGSNSKSGRITG